MNEKFKFLANHIPVQALEKVSKYRTPFLIAAVIATYLGFGESGSASDGAVAQAMPHNPYDTLTGDGALCEPIVHKIPSELCDSGPCEDTVTNQIPVKDGGEYLTPGIVRKSEIVENPLTLDLYGSNKQGTGSEYLGPATSFSVGSGNTKVPSCVSVQ